MKKLLILLFTAFNFYSVSAQQYLAVAREKDLFGYIDEKGNWAIQPVYEDAETFSEGLARVRVKDLWGFIDSKGKLVIEPAFTKVKNFTNGSAGACKNNVWGIIDKSGKWLIEPKYNNADGFISGWARVKVGDLWSYIDKNGNLIKSGPFRRAEPFMEGMARISIKEKWSFIDSLGNIITKEEFVNVGDFSDGFAWVRPKEKVGYINKSGKPITEAKYDIIKEFNEGLGRGFIEKTGWEYVDANGKTVIALDKNIDNASKFSEGLALIKADDRIGYINEKGAIVIKPQFGIGKDFRFGVAPVRKSGGKYFLINTKGEEISANKFEKLNMCDNKLLRAMSEGKYGYVDIKGNWVVKPVFRNLEFFVDVNEIYNSKKYRNATNPFFFESTDFR